LLHFKGITAKEGKHVGILFVVIQGVARGEVEFIFMQLGRAKVLRCFGQLGAGKFLLVHIFFK